MNTLGFSRCRPLALANIIQHNVDFRWKLKPKLNISKFVNILILPYKIEITTNYKISYFGFDETTAWVEWYRLQVF